MGNIPTVQAQRLHCYLYSEKESYIQHCLKQTHLYSTIHDSMVLGIGRCHHYQPSRSSQFSFLRYDVELFQRIEHLIGKKLPVFPTQDDEVMMLTERVSEAQRFARMVRTVSAFTSV